MYIFVVRHCCAIISCHTVGSINREFSSPIGCFRLLSFPCTWCRLLLSPIVVCSFSPNLHLISSAIVWGFFYQPEIELRENLPRCIIFQILLHTSGSNFRSAPRRTLVLSAFRYLLLLFLQ